MRTYPPCRVFNAQKNPINFFLQKVKSYGSASIMQSPEFPRTNQKQQMKKICKKITFSTVFADDNSENKENN